MKKIYFLLWWWGALAVPGLAQQKPQYGQYMLNGFLLNPSLTGIENYTDVKLSYRRQWAGLEGAPTSMYLTAHGPVNKEDRSSSVVSLPAQSKNTIINKLRSKEDNDFANLKAHGGVGGTIVIDKIGFEKREGVSFSYAYHMPVHKKLKWSTGISVGFTRYSLDLDGLDFGPNADPVERQYREGRFLPEFSLGTTLYGRNFYVGASAAQLFQNNFDLNGNTPGAQERFPHHYFLMGGYELRLGKELAVVPSVLVKWVNPSPVSVDLNLKVSYLRQFWLGASYRHENTWVALAGFHFNSLLNLGYAYELTTSDLSPYTSGSHELMLGVVLNNKYKVKSPITFPW
ncbi:MAG: type IX secretion system membrane protein PorP/SprF [Rufibacter sp.]